MTTLGRLLASGKQAEVFEFGAAVVKLFHPSAPKRSIFREAANLAVVESFGLPVPSVHGVQQFGERWGIAMSRISAPTFADAAAASRDRLEEYLTAMAHLHIRMHSHCATVLATAKRRLAADIQQLAALGEARQHVLLRRLEALPDGDRLCHGDFHPFNILGPPGNAVIIDWQNASCGPPAADVCRSYLLMRRIAPDIAAHYVSTYARLSGEDEKAILDWLPVLAAARLTENVPEESASLLELAGQSPLNPSGYATPAR